MLKIKGFKTACQRRKSYSYTWAARLYNSGFERKPHFFQIHMILMVYFGYFKAVFEENSLYKKLPLIDAHLAINQTVALNVFNIQQNV